MSDVASSREWNRLRPALFELHPPTAARHILVLPLGRPQQVGLSAAVARFGGCDFSDRDLRTAAALQPALVALRLVEQALADPASRETRQDREEALTQRETDVLRWLALGLTADTIGRRLGVSQATVRKHLQHIYAKLGCDDRLSAVLTAQRRHLLS